MLGSIRPARASTSIIARVSTITSQAAPPFKRSSIAPTAPNVVVQRDTEAALEVALQCLHQPLGRARAQHMEIRHQFSALMPALRTICAHFSMSARR